MTTEQIAKLQRELNLMFELKAKMLKYASEEKSKAYFYNNKANECDYRINQIISELPEFTPLI